MLSMCALCSNDTHQSNAFPVARNDYDDGHYLLEIKNDAAGGWVLVDIDNNNSPSIGGQALNLLTTYSAIVDGTNSSFEYELSPLASDTSINSSPEVSSAYFSPMHAC
jgi:hypothetical protein